MIEIEKRLKKLSLKAYNNNDVPVAALIVKDGKIISEAYNKRNFKNNVLGHAEILAIIKAQKKLRRWHLNDCILYTTLKPCKMCEAVIFESKITEVVYFVEKTKQINISLKYTKKQSKENIYFEKLLTSFFEKKRCKK